MYWIIDRSGEHRQVWGPYPTLERARYEAGHLCNVVQGRGLHNGQTITRGMVQARQQAGSLWPVQSGITL